MIRKIKEGTMTGSDPAKTGNMVGRYLRRYRRSVNSGESPKKDYLAAKDQAARVGKKIDKRQSSNADYDGEYGEGVEDGKGNSMAAVMGDYDQAFEYEMAPENAPNPTDVKRRAKGNRPYRQRASTELVRGSRLALAEKVISEMSKSQAKEEVRKHQGAPKRSKSGHIIGGSYSHYGDLPKRVRKTLSPTDAFFATDVKETPEENKEKRRKRLRR